MTEANDIYDIAIVGYGPVGAVIANLLGYDGFRVAVIEREPDIYDKPRAIVLDHEIVRSLQACRLAEPVYAITSAHPGTDFVNANGDLIKRFDPMPPPFPLGWRPTSMFIQPELEATLRTGVDRFATVDVMLAHEALSFRQDNEAVSLTVADRSTDAQQTIVSRYLIGCDGANSFVRKALDVGLEDLAFDEWWMVVDTWLTGEADLPDKAVQYCRPSRPATFILGPQNLRRWEIKLLPGERPEAFADTEAVRAQLADFVPVDAIEIWRSAVYRFHALVARQWRDGRVFLMGDAAHQTPPFMGQGMCAGIRDAANFAWKLRFVLKHGAPDALLDSYQAERLPHVRELVATTKAFGEIIGELDPAAAARRDEELMGQLARGEAETIRQRFIPDLTSGLIGSGPLAGTLFVQPAVRGPSGTNCLLDDAIAPGFLLAAPDPTIFDALTPEAREAWRRLGGVTVSISADDKADSLQECDGLFTDWATKHGCGAAIVRPDRYVYETAQDADALNKALVDLGEAVFGH